MKKHLAYLACMFAMCLALAACFALFLLTAHARTAPATPHPVVLQTASTPTAPTKKATATPAPVPTQEPAIEPTPAPTPAPDSSIHIRVVGDIMCHDRQLRASIQEDGSYIMDGWFDDIKPSLAKADLLIGNLETSFAGGEEGYSGFPKFNTPDVMADLLLDAGFDVLTLANNHINDYRAPGIERTLAVLESRGIKNTGAYADRAAYDQLLIVQAKDIRVGVLAYSATFNSTPKKDYHVRALSREQVAKDVAAIKAQGADIVLAMVHWGSEYEESPGSTQRKQAQMLVDEGIDAIFGSHPHVVQKAEYLTAQAADGTQKKVLVAYSMGNFMSNQQNRPCDMGIIFDIEVHKEGATGIAQVVSGGYVPTIVYRGRENHRDTYTVLPCGVYMNIKDHPRRHRCETVWEHHVGIMSDELIVMEN